VRCSRQDGTHAFFRVDEIYKLQLAGARALPLACIYGRWMYRMRDTVVGGFRSAEDGGAAEVDRKTPALEAHPWRLWGSHDAQALRADVVERVVRVHLLFEEPRSWADPLAVEAAALAPLRAGEPPFEYWANGLFNTTYGTYERLPRSWPWRGARDAAAAAPDAAADSSGSADDDQPLEFIGACAASHARRPCLCVVTGLRLTRAFSTPAQTRSAAWAAARPA
jgi:hypothetical protein